MLAYVGGFWKAIFAIGFLLSQLLGYEIFVKSVMKRLYYFEEDPDEAESQQSSSEDDSIERNEDVEK